MIGKPLSERTGLGPLKPDRAVAILTENLQANAAALVQVRAQDPRMVACLVVRAGKAAVRLCLELGLAMRPGGTGVVGFMGSDAARLFPGLTEAQKAWLKAPCGPRETKVLLLAGGIGLLSLETKAGQVVVMPAATASA
jgi:hypothetical protein